MAKQRLKKNQHRTVIVGNMAIIRIFLEVPINITVRLICNQTSCFRLIPSMEYKNRVSTRNDNTVDVDICNMNPASQSVVLSESVTLSIIGLSHLFSPTKSTGIAESFGTTRTLVSST